MSNSSTTVPDASALGSEPLTHEVRLLLPRLIAASQYASNEAIAADIEAQLKAMGYENPANGSRKKRFMENLVSRIRQVWLLSGHTRLPSPAVPTAPVIITRTALDARKVGTRLGCVTRGAAALPDHTLALSPNSPAEDSSVGHIQPASITSSSESSSASGPSYDETSHRCSVRKSGAGALEQRFDSKG